MRAGTRPVPRPASGAILRSGRGRRRPSGARSEGDAPLPSCGTLDLIVLGLLALAALDLWAFGEAGLVGLLLGAVLPRRRAKAGRESLVGARAVAERAFERGASGAPEGPVRVAGERWQARLAPGHTPPPAGALLTVTAVEGLTLEVRPEDEPSGPP